MKYHTIVADPPWPYDSPGGQLTSSSSHRPNSFGTGAPDSRKHYGAMTIEELCGLALPVDDDAHLYLWTTNFFMVEAHEITRAWGFAPKTICTWGKVQPDGRPSMKTGRYFRGATEHVVFAVIAFAYADAIPRLTPIYRGIAEGLCENIRDVMPRARIVHVTDENTAPLRGPDEILCVKRDVPLMTWHMRCHAEAQALGKEVLFTEPDVRFKSEILHVFDDKDFDVAVTEREVDSTWDLNGKKVLLSAVAPYTLGTTFSRSATFWREVTDYCSTLPAKEQNWLGDMLSLYEVMQRGHYKVKVMPGPIYNHIPCSREDACDVKVLHFKGMRKEWLFQQAREAA